MLGMVFYFYAVIGMFLFGGKVRKDMVELENSNDVPNTYHLLNFNDFLSSFITLFALMVVNNWMEITEMYVIVTK